MKNHPTEEIVIKKAHVDVEMIPLINWLNSFSSVTTYYCCQGNNTEKEEDKPYVLFTCFDTIELITILSAFCYHSLTEIHWNETKRCLEYCTRFTDKNSFFAALEYCAKEIS